MHSLLQGPVNQSYNDSKYTFQIALQDGVEAWLNGLRDSISVTLHDMVLQAVADVNAGLPCEDWAIKVYNTFFLQWTLSDQTFWGSVASGAKFDETFPPLHIQVTAYRINRLFTLCNICFVVPDSSLQNGSAVFLDQGM